MEEIYAFNKKIEISNLSRNEILPIFKKLIVSNIIKSSISGYLIKQSYENINEKALNYTIIENSHLNEIYNTDDYIELRFLGSGSCSTVNLIFLIKNKKLCALKKPYGNPFKVKKLYEREYKNYSKIDNPLLPKFYGTVENENYLIIEFIKGEKLNEIDSMDENKAIMIIFYLLLIFFYCHKHNFIYRDLKPNNIIINQNYIPILIDFDRMIQNSIDEIAHANTIDFSSDYIAPEVNYKDYSYYNDIYSIGRIIQYIFNKKLNLTSDLSQNYDFQKLQKICNKCTSPDPKKRPSITDLLFKFYIMYKNKLKPSLSDFEAINLFNDVDIDKTSITKNEYKKLFLTTIGVVLNEPD